MLLLLLCLRRIDNKRVCQLWRYHCHATDQGDSSAYWKGQRVFVKSMKQQQGDNPWDPAAMARELSYGSALPPGKNFRFNCPSHHMGTLVSTCEVACVNCYCYVCHAPYTNTLSRMGPQEQEKQDAALPRANKVCQRSFLAGQA